MKVDGHWTIQAWSSQVAIAIQVLLERNSQIDPYTLHWCPCCTGMWQFHELQFKLFLVGWLVTRYCRDLNSTEDISMCRRFCQCRLIFMDVWPCLHNLKIAPLSIQYAVASILENTTFPPFLYHARVSFPHGDSPADEVGIRKRKKSLDVHRSLP